jgi:hypothetical protein
MIDPTYYQVWFDVIDQAKNKNGWPIPIYVEQYLSAVLANYVDKPDWQPSPSWAETLLQIQSAAAAKVLGDQALFAAAVFPTLLEHKGITDRYIIDIGRVSYNRASRINEQLFITLSRNFEFLTQCLRCTITDNPQIEWYKQ